MSASAAVTHNIPDTGTCGLGPLVKHGGSHVGKSLDSTAKVYQVLASYFNLAGSMSSIMGQYTRRRQEWRLQEQMSMYDQQQIQKQIDAGIIRQAMA